MTSCSTWVLLASILKSLTFVRFLQVKDICNELDVRSLCHKILQNVSTLLHADRGSLFLVQGERSGAVAAASAIANAPSFPNHEVAASNSDDENNTQRNNQSYSRSRCLVSKLFDVCSRSTLLEMEKKDEIKIPWGTGIVGYVAESGEPVNIPDAYKARLGNTVLSIDQHSSVYLLYLRRTRCVLHLVD